MKVSFGYAGLIFFVKPNWLNAQAYSRVSCTFKVRSPKCDKTRLQGDHSLLQMSTSSVHGAQTTESCRDCGFEWPESMELYAESQCSP
ncbi:uncharacterized protein PHALS_01536 [Plasmopara halstedii]|uniref:Uncharacterized protein n=1 Tax=Plasmopara halstedii TaxID=4781 RepID=A0A0P1ASY0_PLAHL|nr:uncharacterized protein PHALS_01536 [Plasmopara halstedii]CEG45224.1 hypothetical protein PHALS_01536 [Plasmopara halstedii]|eukprot:XP_024581593.1 hypothetical protein PHALS_01536 [Plasmopara halstedii]